MLEDKSLSLRETKQTKKLLAKMSERQIQRYMEYVLTPDTEGLIDTEDFLANDIRRHQAEKMAGISTRSSKQ